MISVFLVEDEWRTGLSSYKKEASRYCNYRYMHAFYGRIGVKPFGKKRTATDKDFDFKWS